MTSGTSPTATAEFAPSRKEGFILAARFLRQYMPGRPVDSIRQIVGRDLVDEGMDEMNWGSVRGLTSEG